jgi:hypothetical protein
MKAPALSKLILRLTKLYLNKSFGVRQARIMKVTQHSKKIAEVEKLSKEMGHGSKTQKTYVRKLTD